MHDDGPLTTDESRLDRIRWRARVLRGLLILSTSLSAIPLLHGLGVLGPASSGAGPGLSLILSFTLALCWIAWISEGKSLVEAIGIKTPLGGVGRGWAFAILIPCLLMPVLLWAVYQLSRASDPAHLPPVVEEVEQSAGFRDNAVVRVATGSVAHPLLALWIIAWVLSLGMYPMLLRSFPISTVMVFQALTSLASTLAAWQIVGAVTHNLAELQRRARARLILPARPAGPP